ncbi:hypothetical protein DFH11DRAFT_1880623 [Phellopilus nigrolimitatus]|nr:hypothetical protein DFH11DRAFT_1880623 [Phellopilus nigrolimitatus]
MGYLSVLSAVNTVCGVLVKGFGIESRSGRQARNSRRREAVNGGGVLCRRWGETKIAQEADKALQAAVAGNRMHGEVELGYEKWVIELSNGRGDVVSSAVIEFLGSGQRGERKVRLAHSGFRGTRAVLVVVETLLRDEFDVVAVAAVGNGRTDRPTRSLIAAKASPLVCV